MSDSCSFFATCPKGLEALLYIELKSLGGQDVRESIAGCYFSGGLNVGYKTCLWSRLANSILLLLGEYEANDRDSIYQQVQNIEWSDHMRRDSCFSVSYIGKNDKIRNTCFGAMIVKDAIVDQFKSKTGTRPNIDKYSPDIHIHSIFKKNHLRVYLSLSGKSLHKRGYNKARGVAPLKENISAAILYQAKWPDLLKAGIVDLVDPFCGSGTFLIEAAMMAADVAPALSRDRFGFEKWLGYNDNDWRLIVNEATNRKLEGMANYKAKIVGYDTDTEAIKHATANVERSGFRSLIDLRTQELGKISHPKVNDGLLVMNPPYGNRLDHVDNLMFLYKNIGHQLRTKFLGWEAAVMTDGATLGKQIGMRCRKKHKLYNGAIPCYALMFSVKEENFYREFIEQPQVDSYACEKESESAVIVSISGQMLVNRLKKNLKHLRKWKNSNGLNCYRVYDADIPEYAVAIDVYGDYLHIQEYMAPASIDATKAAERIREVLQIAPSVLSIKPEHVVYKRREKKSPTTQYTRLAETKAFFEVKERGHKFLVNLRDYLDTGLFLDHRLLRAKIESQAKNKRFLNLFCYTATASIGAAMGGAKSTVSVDLSNTYLDWARNNFSLNGLGRSHNLCRADCLSWLAESKETFDLILISPPSFSNSKKMKGCFDVQRDHCHLLRSALRRLSHGGKLYFSTHLKRFALDEFISKRYCVQNISHELCDKDFSRARRSPSCWEVSHSC